MVSAIVEPSLKYHPCYVRHLTVTRESGHGTVPGGQFDWGGLRPDSCESGFLLNEDGLHCVQTAEIYGVVQRYPQRGWQWRLERKGKATLNCATYRSSRYESRT